MIINNDRHPPQLVLDAIGAATTRVGGRIEIYEQDAITRWTGDTVDRLIDGKVSIDYSRDERRSFDLTLDNQDQGLFVAPGYLWYDKIIKIFKRVFIRNADYDVWQTQIGEFMIDEIKNSNFPDQLSVTGRDYTKKCMNSKYVVTTQFNPPNILEDLISAIATAAGISKQIIPVTHIVVDKIFTGERGSTRWELMKKIANAYNYDLYFDPNGNLMMHGFPDPATQTPKFTFQTGASGNLSDFSKTTNDTELYNHVLVVGAAETDSISCWAEARNDDPDSPTSIAEIGDRLYEYDSDFIVLQHNFAQNPSAETNTTHFFRDQGIAGVATLSQITPGFDSLHAAQIQWTVPTSAPSGGLAVETADNTVIGGQHVSFSCMAQSNVAQVLVARVDWRDDTDASIGFAFGSVISVSAGNWYYFEALNKVAPNNTTHVRCGVVAFDPAGSVWHAGNWLQLDTVMIQRATGLAPYFDGGTDPTGRVTWWDGTPDNSSSVNNSQAQMVADSFLGVHQLQQFDVEMSSLNYFYLEVGTVIAWIDPNPSPGDPTLYLLQTLDVPVGLGLMAVKAARLQNVGGA